MPLVAREFKGLDLRNSDINRNPNNASDCRNVHLSSKKELVKRFGYDKLADLGFTAIDHMDYQKESEILALTSTGLKKWNGSSYDDVNFSGSTGNSWSVRPSFDEYNGVLYWTDPSGNSELFKYDGYTHYRAGVPKINATTATGSGGFYYRLYLQYTDPQGNVTLGDYLQFDALADGAAFTINHPQSGFYQKLGRPSSAQIINSGNLTLNVVSGHNYVAGDWVQGDDLVKGAGSIVIIQVESVTATSITFTSSSVGSNSIGFPSRSAIVELVGQEPIENRWMVLIFKSSNANYGYALMEQSSRLNAETSFLVTTPAVLGQVFMEDYYDTTILKGLPPRCKYISFYNNIMVLANKFETPNNSGLESTRDNEKILWSDTGLGSTVETFAPFDFEVIGKSTEGSVSGLFASSDNVVIHKEKQVYYLNGILTGRNFRVRSALSNGIGGVSDRSVIEIEGGCLFMSSRGLFLARDGYKPIEMTDIIEPLFTSDVLSLDLDLSSARSVNDVKEERLYIYIKSNTTGLDIVIVYDYYHKEWFLYDSIFASKGFMIIGNDLYHSDGTSLFKRSSSYNDNGAAIVAYYKNGWEDLGAPSIRKKFTKFIGLSIDSLEWDLSVKTQVNWDSVNDIDDEIISFDDSIMVDDISLQSLQPYSLRFDLRNETKDQGMLLTGYQYIWEPTQEMPKGED